MYVQELVVIVYYQQEQEMRERERDRETESERKTWCEVKKSISNSQEYQSRQ